MQDSIWFETISEEDRGALSASDAPPKRAGVAIVGAGVIGLMSAYYLDRLGAADICVIDRGAALGEASGANAGGLWPGLESMELGELLPMARTSLQLYEELSEEFDFELDRRGVIELAYDEPAFEKRAGELESLRALGVGVEKLGPRELRELEPALAEGPAGALLFLNDGQLHPVKLGVALVRLLRSRGVKFCLYTEVERLGLRLETSRGVIEADRVLAACGAWTPALTRALGWTPAIKPVKGQLLATAPLPPLLRRTVVARRFYYWQLRSGHVAGGGTVEDVGFNRDLDAENRIRSEMDATMPALRSAPVHRVWCGFRPYSEDGRPFIGPLPGAERIYVAAGHFRRGVMLAPATGQAIAGMMTA